MPRMNKITNEVKHLEQMIELLEVRTGTRLAREEESMPDEILASGRDTFLLIIQDIKGLATRLWCQ